MIHSAETFYLPESTIPAAERCALAHWTRIDVSAYPVLPPRNYITLDYVAFAEVSAGRWLAMCPLCRVYQYAAKTDHFIFCPHCLNYAAGGRWVHVEWPTDVEDIEYALGKRAHPDNRFWSFRDTVDDLLAENAMFGLLV